MEVARVTEFSIYLADRPGELAGVLEALAAAGATVTALSVVEQSNGSGVDRKGLLRLLGTPEEAIRRVCEHVTDTGAGPVSEAEVLVVSLGEHAGRFREVAVRLADEKINVRYVYQAPSGEGEPVRLVLRVQDPERAEQVIGDLALPGTGSGPAAGAA